MSSVGSYLRELRERRGLSLDEISRSTRVLHQYLELLEADDLAALPAPAFTRGFIRAYCQVLREPPDEALARYEEGVQPHAVHGHDAALPESRKSRELGTRRENRGRGAVLVSFVLLVVLGVALFLVFVLLVVLGIALFLVTLALQPAGERRGEQRAPASEGAPPAPSAARPSVAAKAPSLEPSSVLPSTTVASGPRPPVPPTSTPVVVIDDVASRYRLVARTTEATWMRVRTGDGRTSEENIPAGEVREWISNEPFVLSIGNAGGVTLELNGRLLPPLGPSGTVIARLVVPPEGP